MAENCCSWTKKFNCYVCGDTKTTLNAYEWVESFCKRQNCEHQMCVTCQVMHYCEKCFDTTCPYHQRIGSNVSLHCLCKKCVNKTTTKQQHDHEMI